jgi:hypothetical protein
VPGEKPRFIEGKYSVGHAFGVMCGFSPNDLDEEAVALATYSSRLTLGRLDDDKAWSGWHC